MSEYRFAVLDVVAEPYAAAPQLTARLRIDEVDQLAGQNRDVLLGHVKQCGQEMR